MNIDRYITSGIVESYVLGLTSPGEAAQLEELLPFYPELQEALSDFGYQLELFAIENEIPPPPGIREKIESRVRGLPDVRRPSRQQGQHARNGNGQQPEFIAVRTSSPYINVHKNWRVVFVVFCIMSKIFLALFIYYFVQYQHARKDIRQLEEQLGRREQVIRAPQPGN